MLAVVVYSALVARLARWLRYLLLLSCPSGDGGGLDRALVHARLEVLMQSLCAASVVFSLHPTDCNVHSSQNQECRDDEYVAITLP